MAFESIRPLIGLANCRRSFQTFRTIALTMNLAGRTLEDVQATVMQRPFEFAFARYSRMVSHAHFSPGVFSHGWFEGFCPLLGAGSHFSGRACQRGLGTTTVQTSDPRQ